MDDASPEAELRTTVLSDLEAQGQRALACLLEPGAWTLISSEVVVRVTGSAKVIETALRPEVRRMADAAASRAAGRPVKLRVEVLNGAPVAAPQPAGNGASSRTRASEDPIVRRMQEKFGAEIRSVIDHKKP